MPAISFKVGEITITKIVESCGPGFVPEFLYPDWDPAVLDEHRHWLIPQCYSEAEGAFIASVHSWLVRTRHHLILIDCCAGNHKERPLLKRFHRLELPFLQRLHDAGVDPADIDFVLCSHLHVDHCGWNTRLESGRWVPTFPNARYVFSRIEKESWETRADDQGLNANVYNDSVLPVIEAGLSQILEDPEDFWIGDELSAISTPGHTAGHLAFKLSSGGREGLFAADVMHQPLQVYRPEWNSRFCETPDEARRTRRWMLEHCAETGSLVLPAHFAGSSAGYIRRYADRFAWTFAR